MQRVALGVYLEAVTVAKLLLSVQGLTKKFGGVKALSAVGMDVKQGSIHAVIGPNGAGKTTLINLITGRQRADSGRIWYCGGSIDNLSSEARARHGIVRTFQITSIFPSFSALDNAVLAIQAREGRNFGCWSPVRDDKGIQVSAREYLVQVGLGDHEDTHAAHLSHGQRRLLELAMVLATQPRLLILDEPMAGLSIAESKSMVELLGALKCENTLLMIEHDMDVVFSLADYVTVLDRGVAIACGVPEKIRSDIAVQKAYLGEVD